MSRIDCKSSGKFQRFKFFLAAIETLYTSVFVGGQTFIYLMHRQAHGGKHRYTGFYSLTQRYLCFNKLSCIFTVDNLTSNPDNNNITYLIQKQQPLFLTTDVFHISSRHFSHTFRHLYTANKMERHI